MRGNLTLSILPNLLSIAQLDKGAEIPTWALASSFFSISRTADELSVVCDQSVVPPEVKKVGEWRAFKVLGPLDFSLTGIVASLARVLAEHEIPVFVISTYDTDYVLVQRKHFDNAKSALAEKFNVTD